MKQWLFTRQFNRFDLIAIIAYTTALIKIDFGFNLDTLMLVAAFVVACAFSVKMEDEVHEETVSKKAR